MIEASKMIHTMDKHARKSRNGSIAENDLEGKKRRREKRARHKEYRRQLREQQAAEAARLAEAVGIECMYSRETAAFWNKL